MWFIHRPAFISCMATSLESETPVQGRATIDEVRAPRAPRRRRRTAALFAVDAGLFAIFLLVVNVPFTGLAIHEWLGVLIGVGFTAHLLQHAEWIVTTTRRFMTASSLQNRFNYLLMIGLFAGFASIIVSGLLISEIALPWIGVTPNGGTFWLWLHLGSVGWVIWLTAIHIATNWRWIAHAADRLIFRPVSKLADPR